MVSPSSSDVKDTDSDKQEELSEITTVIKSLFTLLPFGAEDFGKIIGLMKQDKKNINGKLNFTLLKSIGKGLINQYCTEESVEKTLEFYCELNK